MIYLEEDIATTGEIIPIGVRSEALVTHENHPSIAHLNTQSISSTFDEFQVMLYHYLFDIITWSDTWLRNDRNLQQYIPIPGYNLCYRICDER